MPYIKKAVRRELDAGNIQPRNAGELNYELTKFIYFYIMNNGESYQTYNDVLGVLSAIPHELYRRKIAPYEDKKIKENGDVYGTKIG